jgi:hypothetical protein
VNAHEIMPGVIYKDATVTVTAFAKKLAMESYGYRFDTPAGARSSQAIGILPRRQSRLVMDVMFVSAKLRASSRTRKCRNVFTHL